MIVIVDYGLGNLGSIKNMLKKVGYNDAVISQSADQIMSAQKLILPGVGAFDKGMQQLVDTGLIPVLNNFALVQKKPVLGICLGAQLMCNKSEEGELKGLGWFDAEVKRFLSTDINYKIPHMGWNEISIAKPHYLVTNLPNPARFYFVHSYYIETKNSQDILASCQYGINFCASMQKENIIGMQFHPEKSHKFGMHIFSKFIAA